MFCNATLASWWLQSFWCSHENFNRDRNTCYLFSPLWPSSPFVLPPIELIEAIRPDSDPTRTSRFEFMKERQVGGEEKPKGDGVRVDDVGITYPGARAIPAIFNLFQVPFRGGEKKGVPPRLHWRREIPLYRRRLSILRRRSRRSRGFDTAILRFYRCSRTIIRSFEPNRALPLSRLC